MKIYYTWWQIKAPYFRHRAIFTRNVMYKSIIHMNTLKLSFILGNLIYIITPFYNEWPACSPANQISNWWSHCLDLVAETSVSCYHASFFSNISISSILDRAWWWFFCSITLCMHQHLYIKTFLLDTAVPLVTRISI